MIAAAATVLLKSNGPFRTNCVFQNFLNGKTREGKHKTWKVNVGNIQKFGHVSSYSFSCFVFFFSKFLQFSPFFFFI